MTEPAWIKDHHKDDRKNEVHGEITGVDKKRKLRVEKIFRVAAYRVHESAPDEVEAREKTAADECGDTSPEYVHGVPETKKQPWKKQQAQFDLDLKNSLTEIFGERGTDKCQQKETVHDPQHRFAKTFCRCDTVNIK